MVQNGKPLGQLLITLGLDTTAFSSSLTGATRASKTAAKEMAAGFKIVDSGGDKLSALSFKQQALTKVISAQKNELGYLKQAYDKTLDSQGNATSKTAAAAQKYNDAQARLAGYKQELIDTAGSLAELQVKTTGATGAILSGSEKMISAGKGMENVGSAMTKGLTVPIVAGATAVTTAAISWESAFAGVKKTNDEVTDSTGKVVYSYKDLENGLRGLAKELPSSHQEIAAVAEAAGQLGIETPNVVGFTKTMIDLGESTNMSAETAATALARFANITQMSQGDFDRLGAVIVDLGNNFATTESEITEMGLRLAGAGKQIGMSEGEIMGFAAALSSVGIEAEAGGSAFSKVMIQMQLATETGKTAFSELEAIAKNGGVSLEELTAAIAKGGKTAEAMGNKVDYPAKQLKGFIKTATDSSNSLKDFSDVAGMTSVQFAELFKSNPSEAIMKFVDGLAHAEERGTSAIKVLDDMGITEVRLRDSLLRASNASGVFSGAVEMGNKAWGENTALTEEANKRYETTESKLKMLKNEVIDSAIELGGPFVDALRAGLESSKPLIKAFGDLAKSFSDADPKTQQMIVKLLAATAAAGPLLSITGKLTSGIGGLGKSFVELSAQMAKKKAIAELSEQLVKGTVNVNTLSTALGGGATKVGAFGSAASTAAGSSGIGAMSAALGPLGPAILGIVGVGGALAVGYGAWKLFGEEAWNSSQRVQRWGTDVGQATDEALTNIQGNSQKATGEFNLMEQGFSGNTEKIVSNFQKIGSTIENDLTSKLEAYKKAVELLPTELQDKANEMVGENEKQIQKVTELVKENNERILQIKKEYVDAEGEINFQGAKMIQDLMKQSTEEYLKIAVKDAGDRKNVMVALTGDIESATQEQAEAWVRSLSKQRQATKSNYTEDINDYRKKLEDTKQLNKEEIDMLVGIYEEARETSTKSIDAQLTMIAEKYPELAKKISFVTGQTITGMGEAATAFVEENENIIKKSNELSNQLAKNSKENAETASWTASEGTKAGKTWNALKLLDKELKVKTNASEIVIEATKDAKTWNEIRFQLNRADLNSNAKLIIGEAAIANGWWDGMAWEDKQAVLKDEFSQNMYKALRDTGKWNEMSFEEKKAILYSNTPEIMAETMMNLGLWEDCQPQIKELKAKNYNFLSILNESEEKMNHWNTLPEEIKNIVGDNNDFLEKIYSSETAYTRWKEFPDEEKQLLANNVDLLTKIMTSETSLTRWNQLPAEQKQLLADNADLSSKVFASEETYKAWVALPDNIKRMLADNVDLNSKIADGTLKLEQYKANEPGIKRLLGDAASVVDASSQANQAIDRFAKLNDPMKNLTANDLASRPAADATGAITSFESKDNTITKTLRVVADYGSKVAEILGFEKGTNYHMGGPAIVNDQTGPNYKELVIPKGGTPFIAEGRDVLLPDLPRGSKVLTASQTKRLIPHYADGVGVPENSTLVRNLRAVNSSEKTVVVKNDNNSALIKAINGLKSVIANQQNSSDPINLNVKLGETEFKRFIEDISELQGKEISIQRNF